MYLMVESQGGWVGPGTAAFLRDVLALAERGEAVWLLLIENGVTCALAEGWQALGRLAQHGGHLWVDGYSLCERGLDAAALVGGASVVDMDTVAAKLLEPGVRVVWH